MNTVHDARDKPQPATPPPVMAGPTCVRSEALFLGRREIQIEHAGERYRLRLTRNNRLILTK